MKSKVEQDNMSIVHQDSKQELILQKTKDLTAAICSTKAYRQYRKNLIVLKENEEIRQKLNAFRRKRIELDELDEGMAEEEAALMDEYKDILNLPLVTNFLTSEALMNRMLKAVYDRIAEDVRIDLSYLDQ